MPGMKKDTNKKYTLQKPIKDGRRQKAAPPKPGEYQAGMGGGKKTAASAKAGKRSQATDMGGGKRRIVKVGPGMARGSGYPTSANRKSGKK